MRTESYQLPGETIEQFRERQRKLRQRRDDETRTSSLGDSSSTPFNSFDSSFSSVFDSSSPVDSSTSDSFSGGGGNFGGGGASSDY